MILFRFKQRRFNPDALWGFFLGAILFLPSGASALEGFKFVGQYPLALEKPSFLTPVGGDRLAVYDSKADEISFLDADGKAGDVFSLSKTLTGKYKSIDGLTFNATHESLFVLDARKKAIFVLTANGSYVRTIDLDIDGPVSISRPSSLAIDASGRIYIGDPGNDDIKVFSLQGIFLFNIIRPLRGEDSTQRMNATALTVLADGSIAVAEYKTQKLLRFSRDGQLIGQNKLEGHFKRVDRLIATEPGELIGFDGKLQKIFKWDLEGRLTAVFGARGPGRGEFECLADVVPDTKGNILALDKDKRDLQIFSFEKPAQDLAGRAASPAYAIDFKQALSVDQGIVTVLPDGVVLFDEETRTVLVRRGDSEIPVTHPEFRDVTAGLLTGNRLYLFDQDTCKVYTFSLPDGKFAFTFGGKKGDGRLDEIVRIIPGPGNTLYLADMGDTKIKVFTDQGLFSVKFGKRGAEDAGDIGHLQDIAWHEKKLAVLDSKRQLIHLFDANGRLDRNVELRGITGKLGLASIAVDVNGFFLLLDQRNARVLVVHEDGQLSYRFGSSGDRSLDWKRPQRLDVDEEGKLQLVDQGKPVRLMQYHLRTAGPLTRIATAIDKKNWREVNKLLETYLTSDGPKKDVQIPGFAEAIRLGVEAHTKSEGKCLSAKQLLESQQFLNVWLFKNSNNIAARLALAQSFKNAGRIEDAILMLRAAPKGMSDPRCDALERVCMQQLNSSGQAKVIVAIDYCIIPPIFPVLYQNYYDKPVITLKLTNKGGRRSPKGWASCYAKAVMDNPTETVVPEIEPFSSLTVSMKAAITRNALTYTDPTRLAAIVEVRLVDTTGETRLKKNTTFELLGRNSIDWKSEKMIACFVTPQDPDVQVFARQALKKTVPWDLDAHLHKALTMFDAMQSIGMSYLPDPRQPFNFARLSTQADIDYVQYPRETLRRQSGDCDDLSVLYAALLEGVGIPALLVTSPGHIFTAFALKNGPQAISTLGLSEDLLIEHDGLYYIPVETTQLGGPFISAWRVAASTISQYKPEGKIGIIDLKTAWANYKPVSLPPQEGQVPLPKEEALALLLRSELDALNLKHVEKRMAVYKEWLENDPKNMNLLLFLARSYGEVGLFTVAEQYATRADKLQPGAPEVLQLLGNLAYIQNKYAEAIRRYNEADKRQRSASLQMNLALSYLKSGKVVDARAAYKKAKDLDPKLVSRYPEVGQLLE